MWPGKKQIEVSKAGKPASNSQSKGADLDKLWAIARRLQSRVDVLEAQLSTVRRDLYRVDKKVYREEDKVPATILPDNGKGGHGVPPEILEIIGGI